MRSDLQFLGSRAQYVRATTSLPETCAAVGSCNLNQEGWCAQCFAALQISSL